MSLPLTLLILVFYNEELVENDSWRPETLRPHSAWHLGCSQCRRTSFGFGAFCCCIRNLSCERRAEFYFVRE